MTEPAGGESTFEFFGETFAFNTDISEWELMQFAEAADNGEDSNSLQGMASLSRFVKELVAPDNIVEGEGDAQKVTAWGRAHFEASARRNRAKGDDLYAIVYKAFGVAEGDRPTQRPSDSSAGPSSTPLRSVSNSAERAARLFPGRPDLQIVAALTA